MNIYNNVNAYNSTPVSFSAPIKNNMSYQAPNSFASASIGLPEILTLLNQLVSLLSNGSLNNAHNPSAFNAGGFNPQNRYTGQAMQPQQQGQSYASLPWTNVNANQYSTTQNGFQGQAPVAYPTINNHYNAMQPAFNGGMNHYAQPNMDQNGLINQYAAMPNQGGMNHQALPAMPNQGGMNHQALPAMPNQGGMNHHALPAMPNQGGMNHHALPAMPNQVGMNPAVAANKPADAEPKKVDNHAGHNHGNKEVAKKPEAMPEIANKPAMPQGMNGMQGMPGMNGMQGMPGMNGMQGMHGMNGMQGMPGMDHQAMPGMNMEDMYDEDGKMKPGHDFYAHVSHMYPETLANNQSRYGGYSWINGNTLVAKSPITGMQPVIDQAIDDVMAKAANKRLSIGELESKVANRLTQLNDWTALTDETQEKLVELTGVDFGEMTKAEREKSINHLLHSPLPFGAVTETLTPDMRVDLGYTHTLDQNKTMYNDLGNGLFNVTLISNNNNGSHTGHNLGSFNVQLDADATDKEAKAAVKEMLVNTNDNNKLYLDSVARDQLYQYKAAE